MPNRHSLFWRLVVLVAGFCLSMIWAGGYVGRQIDRASSYLTQEAHEVLAGYADEARTALQQGPEALEQWLRRMRQRESSWLVVVDEQLQPLGGRR